MKFEIGEVAILIADGNKKGSTKGCEVECEVISIEHEMVGLLGYEIIIDGDICGSPFSRQGEWFVSTVSLRKKKPPEGLSSWEEIQKLTNWNPSKQVINE